MTNVQSGVAEAQKQIAASADQLNDSAKVQTESADRRTELAADRTVLAAERTYAAWVRTGLASLASGVGARAMLERVASDWLGSATGTILVVFAAFCFVAAIWRQMMRIAPRPDAARLPAALLLTVSGFLVLVCLAALVGIWLR